MKSAFKLAICPSVNLPSQVDSRLGRADFRPERIGFRLDRADFRPKREISGLREPGVKGRTTGWMNEGTNETPPVFYRTLSFLWPLPCFLSLKFAIMQSRTTGIADHILLLGNLLNLRNGRLSLSLLISS